MHLTQAERDAEAQFEIDNEEWNKMYWGENTTTPALTPLHPVVEALVDRHGGKGAEQRTDAWLLMRSKMLTASDVAAAIGSNPYQSINELFKRKTGQSKAFTGNRATEWGTRLEPEALEIYERTTGRLGTLEFGCIPHPAEGMEWLGGSPDGVTRCGRLIEIKCPMSREIRNECPGHYTAQIQVLMEILDLEVCDFVQYRPGSPPWTEMEFDICEVKRDRAWFAKNVGKMRNFWERMTKFNLSGGRDDGSVSVAIDTEAYVAPPQKKRQRTGCMIR